MSKRQVTIALSGKESKRKKSIPQIDQRKLESFFRKRSIDCENSTPASPESGDNSGKGCEAIMDDSNDTDSIINLSSCENSADRRFDVDVESPSSASPEGSSPVDAESTDEVQPFFATSMYTDEFEKIMDTVLDGEKYLFSEEELEVVEKHRSLHTEAKHLFVRIFLRKHKWIRLQKTDYSRNISDINKARDGLCSPNIKFARDETDITDLAHLLDMLGVEELKTLIQNLRIPTIKSLQQNRSAIVGCILDYSNDDSQKILRFEQKSTDGQCNTRELQSRNDILISHIRGIVGPCIILEDYVRSLFEKMHFVYYRSSVDSRISAMTAAILVRTSRRTFPSYIVCRSTDFWPNRTELLDYYDAVRTHQSFTDMMENLYANRKNDRAQNEEQWRAKEATVLHAAWSICETILDKWKDIIKEKSALVVCEDDWDGSRLYFRKRFEAGWVYTQMLEEGTSALARLHDYEKEVSILQMLLSQNTYRLGKRGAWYDRLALVQMNHLRNGNRRIHLKAALETCIKAIRDPKVHLIYMSSLQRRIMRLESVLNIPKREQHDFFYNVLTSAKERTVYGERLSDAIIGAKSVFRNNDGGECSVEELALGYYKKVGYTGFHSENGIITTIFGLLFWDILFAPFPDVLETPYQHAPLDLSTDAFFVGRSCEIYSRLRDISNGKAPDIIKEVDVRERESKTWCVGVKWDYTLEEILQISECIGPNALSQICKVFAEEYEHRTGGMPDLCCWNYVERKCLFVEVKGPGDTLSETQKVWIDLLINAGVEVELCHVKVWDGEDELLKN